MATIYHSEAGQNSFPERVHVSSVVDVEAATIALADGIMDRLLAAAENHPRSKGPLRIEAQHEEGAKRFKVNVTGSLRATGHVINHKSAAGRRLFEDSVRIGAEVAIEGIERAFAISIANHLLAAAQGHPQSDGPLHVDTAFDEERGRLAISLAGTVYSLTYLLGIVELRLEQRRTPRIAVAG